MRTRAAQRQHTTPLVHVHDRRIVVHMYTLHAMYMQCRYSYSALTFLTLASASKDKTQNSAAHVLPACTLGHTRTPAARMCGGTPQHATSDLDIGPDCMAAHSCFARAHQSPDALSKARFFIARQALVRPAGCRAARATRCREQSPHRAGQQLKPRPYRTAS